MQNSYALGSKEDQSNLVKYELVSPTMNTKQQNI